MEYYSGLDVSLETTFISIIDEKGKIVSEANVKTGVESIYKYLAEQNLAYERIGLESGQLSISLCKGLVKKGLNVICVEARHMAAALSAKINKNDKNDARGIAQMMRVDLYKTVKIKSDESCQIKMLLGSRRQLVNTKQQVNGSIRGLLKIYGLKIGARTATKSFAEKVKESISKLDSYSKASIEALLVNSEQLEKSILKLDKLLIKLGKEDKACKLLMTVPGVGIITALSYKSSLDDPTRFEDSEVVGAYMGLTPKQYSSGEVDRHGHISKMGPKECRSMLYEAAQSILTVCKKSSKLKTWGLKIMKKKGMKKAAVAVARKLAVIMHRMLIDEKEFCYN